MKNIIHFETLGCRLNQDETEGAAHSFSEKGFVTDLKGISAKTETNEDVILAVINTCTVTTKAEQKARRLIRLMLQKYPQSVVLVSGCYAELDGDEIKKIDPRICILGGTKKFLLKMIPDYILQNNQFDSVTLQSFIDGYKKSASVIDSFTLFTPVFSQHSRASIKIQDGCNNNCSFCRIHLARGKSVSLDVEEVLNRVMILENQGTGEVVFTGVNLSQYAGKNREGKIFSFKDLLEFLLEKTSRIKFRISSFYPQHITEELCCVLKHERVQPSFHLSIQSGSDRILKLMNRPYESSEVYKAVELLRKSKQNPFISCDIIAGFPSESEEDFEQTKEMCSSLHFAWVHAFPFSDRPGTVAFDMKPKIPERIKDERVKWLSDYSVDEKVKFIDGCRGLEFVATVERKRFARWTCVTSNFLHAEFEYSEILEKGSQVVVRIGEPLKDNIISGKETECTAVFVKALN